MRSRFAAVFIVIVTLMSLMTLAAQSSQADTMLEAARKKEVVDGDYPAAIKQYQAIVNQFVKTDRRAAATALVRMADCYQKLGDKQASAVLQQVVTDFQDQTALVTEARTKLAASRAQNALPAVAGEAHLVCRSPDSNCHGGTISRDGKWLVSGGSVWGGDLGIREMSTGRVTTVKVTNGQGLHSHRGVFSPDNRDIAYHWGDDVAELRVVRNEPGAKFRTLVGNQDIGNIEPLAWQAPGRILVRFQLKKDQIDQLAWVSASNGAVTPIRSLGWRLRGDTSFPEVVLSPDGRFIAYSALVDAPTAAPPAASASARFATSDQHLYIVAADGSGPEVEITKTRGIDHNPLWTADGNHVLFSSNRAGTVDLWAQPMRDGKVAGLPFRIKSGIGNYQNVGVTNTGLFYYVRTQPNLEQIVIADLDTNGSLPATPRITHRLPGRRPSLSPDGRKLAFSRLKGAQSAKDQIVVHNLETGDERVFAVDERPDKPAIWLPDGTGFIQISDPLTPKGDRVWSRFDLNRGTFVKMTGMPDPMFFNLPQMTADGRTLYMLGGPINTNGEFDQIIAVDVATGASRVLANLPAHGGSVMGPALSPDGRTLAFNWASPDRQTRTASTIGVDGTGLRGMVSGPKPLSAMWLVWTTDARGLLFGVNEVRNDCRLMRRNVATGIDEFTGVQFQVPGTLACQGGYSIGPAGKRIAYSTVDGGQELWAIDVSPAALAKKAK